MPYDLYRLQRDIAQVWHDEAGFGTGRLVAENLILTAAHTLWNDESGTGPFLTDSKVRSRIDRAGGPSGRRIASGVALAGRDRVAEQPPSGRSPWLPPRLKEYPEPTRPYPGIRSPDSRRAGPTAPLWRGYLRPAQR